MITMRAPRPFFEQYTHLAHLYRADDEGRLQLILDQKTGETTYSIDGRDLADLRAGGCVETQYHMEDLVRVNEANARVGRPIESSPLVPATEEEAAEPVSAETETPVEAVTEEVVQEPEPDIESASAPSQEPEPAQNRQPHASRRRG